MNQKIALKQMAFMKKNSRSMRLAAEKWRAPWQTLISTILSAQTRDETTIPISNKLYAKYNTLNKLANARLSDVQKTIRSINFYKNKSKNIINCAKMLIKEYKSKVPKDINELIKLPGVGRKTANVFVTEYGDQGLAVDTHVFQISKRLGWTKAKTPDKAEQDLRKFFNKKYWSRVNVTLVRFGKTYTSRKIKDSLIEEMKKIK